VPQWHEIDSLYSLSHKLKPGITSYLAMVQKFRTLPEKYNGGSLCNFETIKIGKRVMKCSILLTPPQKLLAAANYW
jgi:hypothetical protein